MEFRGKAGSLLRYVEVSSSYIADYPVERGEEKSCLRVYKMWEGMEAKELGNKKLEPWEHWLVFICPI